MSKLNVTPGEWTIDPLNEISVIDNSGDVFNQLVCQTNGKGGEERKANALLIADAGTTYNKCQQLPSELLEQNEEFKDALNQLLNACDTYHVPRVEAIINAYYLLNKY